MKFYITKPRHEYPYSVIAEDEITDKSLVFLDHPFGDEDEAQECCAEWQEEDEYQSEMMEEMYYEENRDAIRQSEQYEAFRNEY